MAAKGAEALSDFELLQIIIGSGVPGADVGKIARKLKKLLKEGTENITFEKLAEIKGVGNARASKLVASFELTKRYTGKDYKPIESAEDALPLLADIRDKQQEHFVCITLDGANRVIERRTISIGTLTASMVHPREVFADAITDRAASVIVAHNHPSSNTKPSAVDREVTKRLKSAAKLLGVKLTDHIIVTKKDFCSFKQNQDL